MAKLEAKNIVVTKTTRGLPGGNAAIDYRFTSDIYVDGVEHHKLNVPPKLGDGFPVPAATTLEAAVTKYINDHLREWAKSAEITTVLNLPDIEFKAPEAPVETPEQIALREFNQAVASFNLLTAAVEKATKAEIPLDKGVDAQLAAAKQDVADRLAASPEFIKILGR